MKKIFEFQCTVCNKVADEYTEYKQESVCPSCGGKSEKIISAVRSKLEGWSGAFPGAAMRWERMHKSTGNHSEE